MGWEGRLDSTKSRTASRIRRGTREGSRGSGSLRETLQVPAGKHVLGTLIRIGPLSELPPGTMKGIEHEGRRILIANLEGKLHAWDGRCTHEEADVSIGFLIVAEGTCPPPLAWFNLLTG